MAKKIVCSIFMLVLFVWSIPCYAAATFDSTGLWEITQNMVTKDPGGNIIPGPGIPTFYADCLQLSLEPNDSFELSTDFTTPISGHVFDDLYVIDGPTGSPFGIPPDSRPWFFIGLETTTPGVFMWGHFMIDTWDFTVTGNGTTLEGSWDATMSGYYFMDNPSPVNTLYYNPVMDGNTVEATFTGSKVVPIPGALWLLGSGFIGVLGFRKKFKKA